jgi:hypothetical protein
MKNDIHSAVISEKIRKTLFPGESPLGKSISVTDAGYNEIQLMVCGVFRDIPDISTIRADLVIPFTAYLKTRDWTENWGNKSFLTTVELYAGTDEGAFNRKITSFVNEEKVVCPVIQ